MIPIFIMLAAPKGIWGYIAQRYGISLFPAGYRRPASPCEMNDLPQNLLEPIVIGAACGRGTKARFNSQYLSHTQDIDSVTAEVCNRKEAAPLGAERRKKLRRRN